MLQILYTTKSCITKKALSFTRTIIGKHAEDNWLTWWLAIDNHVNLDNKIVFLRMHIINGAESSMHLYMCVKLQKTIVNLLWNRIELHSLWSESHTQKINANYSICSYDRPVEF